MARPRNVILTDIVKKVGGIVTDPNNRNSLLQDWLIAIGGGPAAQRYFAQLNGTDAYYVIANPVTYTGDFEIEFELSTTSTGTQVILSSDGDVDFVQLRTSGTELTARVGGVTTTFTIANVIDARFHLVKLAFVSTTCTLTIDDNFVASLTCGVGATFSRVGSLVSGSQFFDGIMANTKFTDLSGAQPVTTTFPIGLGTGDGDIEYPTENVFGAELVVNGDFIDGTADWTGSGATLSASSGILSITSTTAFGSGQQALGSLDDGATYLVTASGITTTGASGKVDLKFFNSDGSSASNNLGSAAFLVTGSSGFNTISIGDFGDGNGTVVEVSDISVVKITNALTYVNIPDADRELFQLSGDETQWDNISPEPQELPAIIEIAP